MQSEVRFADKRLSLSTPAHALRRLDHEGSIRPWPATRPSCSSRCILANERLDETAHLAAIVNSSDVAIYSQDLDGTLTSWNHAAEEMFGYSASEALGQSIYLIIPDDRREEEADVQRRIHAGERVPHYETVRRTKRGELIDVSMVASPITHAGRRHRRRVEGRPRHHGAAGGGSEAVAQERAHRSLGRSDLCLGSRVTASSNGTPGASDCTAIRAAKPSAGSATNCWRRSIPGQSMRSWSGSRTTANGLVKCVITRGTVASSSSRAGSS